METIKLDGYAGYRIIIDLGNEIYYRNNIEKISFWLYYDGALLRIVKYEYDNQIHISSFSSTPMKRIMESFLHKGIVEEIAKENIKIILYFLKQLMPKDKYTLKDIEKLCYRHFGIKL